MAKSKKAFVMIPHDDKQESGGHLEASYRAWREKNPMAESATPKGIQGNKPYSGAALLEFDSEEEAQRFLKSYSSNIPVLLPYTDEDGNRSGRQFCSNGKGTIGNVAISDEEYLEMYDLWASGNNAAWLDKLETHLASRPVIYAPEPSRQPPRSTMSASADSHHGVSNWTQQQRSAPIGSATPAASSVPVHAPNPSSTTSTPPYKQSSASSMKSPAAAPPVAPITQVQVPNNSTRSTPPASSTAAAPPAAPITQVNPPRSATPTASSASSTAASTPPKWQPVSDTEIVAVQQLHINQGALLDQKRERSYHETEIQRLEREKGAAISRSEKAQALAADVEGTSSRVTGNETRRIEQYEAKQRQQIISETQHSLSSGLRALEAKHEVEYEKREALLNEALVIAAKRKEPLTKDHLALAEAKHERSLFTDDKLRRLQAPDHHTWGPLQGIDTRASDRSSAANYELRMIRAQDKLDAASERVVSSKGGGVRIPETINSEELLKTEKAALESRCNGEKESLLQQLSAWCSSEKQKIPEKVTQEQSRLEEEAVSQKKESESTVQKADKEIGEHQGAISKLSASIAGLSTSIASLGASISGFIEKFSASFSKKTSATPEGSSKPASEDSSKPAGAPLTSAPDSTIKPETEAPTLGKT